MITYAIYIIAGFVLLLAGAEGLVRGGTRLARSIGLTPLFIGLTVVALGTSLPELGVSVVAQLQRSGVIALANVAGSNIANIGLVLGVAACIQPISIDLQTIRRDVPCMIAATILLWWCARGSVITAWEGLLLLAVLLAYLAYTYQSSRQKTAGGVVADLEEVRVPDNRRWQYGLIAGGCIGLAAGGQLVVIGAMGIARQLGISELFIALTLVAVGTSLPELAASIVAIRKREPAISIGNVVGSCLFNILMVIGVCALLGPVSVDPQAFRWDLPIMVVFAVVCLLVMWNGRIVTRKGGVGLLALYALYMVSLYGRQVLS